MPWLRGKCGTSEDGSYVKRRPTDGAAPAWAAPHTVCAGYAQVRGRGGGAARRLTIEATAGKLPYVRGS